MLEQYRAHTADRAAQGVPPLPLDAEQTAALCELLQSPPAGEEAFLVELLRDRMMPSIPKRPYEEKIMNAIVRGEVPFP
ncbi:MAG: hypothetical protein HC860_16630 [Alkalinema sp. RU_4_3]|nr:hypothetical protein [Alkalinema sp. RU_4_3]